MNRRNVLISALAAGAATANVRPAAAQACRPRTVRTRDGVGLFHRDWGDGPTVLFAASWALSSEMWAYQVAHLSDRGFRCVAYDRRGHGRSDAPGRGYDMDTLADDLAAVIQDLDLRDVTLVGHSIRGAVLKVYEEAPHGLFVTHMDRVNRDLEAFLRA